MKNMTEQFQKYPEKFVDPAFMKHAATLEDIKTLSAYEISVVANKIIGKLYYTNEGMCVDLGSFRLVIMGSSVYLSSFDTANLVGIDSEYLAIGEQFQDVHVLKCPIKYIGRDMFAKVLAICKEKNIKELTLTPLEITQSVLFYQKMAAYFSEYIDSSFLNATGDLQFLLK